MPGRRVPVPSVLRTHPETRERIARLMALKPELPGKSAALEVGADLGRHSAFGEPVARAPRWHINGLWY